MLGENLDYSPKSRSDFSLLLSDEDLSELKLLASEPVEKIKEMEAEVWKRKMEEIEKEKK